MDFFSLLIAIDVAAVAVAVAEDVLQLNKKIINNNHKQPNNDLHWKLFIKLLNNFKLMPPNNNNFFSHIVGHTMLPTIPATPLKLSKILLQGTNLLRACLI